MGTRYTCSPMSICAVQSSELLHGFLLLSLLAGRDGESCHSTHCAQQHAPDTIVHIQACVLKGQDRTERK